MKKITKRLAALLLSALMLVALLPATAFAANWAPDDQITINVRVYDVNTGKTYNVGTDYARKGDQYIQSDAYKIPPLTNFTGNSYGTIQKVVGNWYFPSGDSQVGANVYWSCNANSVTMTYWVTNWSTGTGSGTGSNSDETIDYGSSGSKVWSQIIVYHSNYPNGTDYTYTVTYRIKSYVATANYNLKTIEGCGFSVPDGYTKRDRVWDTLKNGTGANYADGWNYPFNQSNSGKTIHLYAQWNTQGGTPTSVVTLTYKDGDETYATRSCFVGESNTIIDCDNIKDGYTFLGWDTSSGASTVVYEPGDLININSNTTLYAVWEKKAVPVDYALRYDANGGENAPADQTISSTDSSAVFTISDTVPARTGYKFVGWADSENAAEVTYIAGDEVTLSAEASDKTIYAVWEEDPQVHFVGAAIRVPETHYHDNTYEENVACGGLDKTNLRFGYVITLPDDADMDDVEWSWNWGLDPENLNNKVEGTESMELGANTFRSNLVITNIPIATDYKTVIYAQLTMTYTDKEGNEITLVDGIQSRSVEFVANAIQMSVDNGNSNETERVVKYIADLLQRVKDLGIE